MLEIQRILTPYQLKIYSSINGKNRTRDIAKLNGFHRGYIQTTYKRLEKLGLIYKKSRGIYDKT